ncbi:MAG: insulinase family protein [Ignavibacteriaceae bacterium]|nr:insulinase family protein [Ignavibacteriaceae bacterium]
MNILDVEYEKYKLNNGLQVILHKEPALPIVSVNLWYHVGSANEKRGKTGLAHLFEHMMFQGSQNVPKEMHFRYIQEAGGILNGSTNFDRTNYYEKVPSNFLELALWLEADRMGYFLPTLTQEKLNNQKDVVKNERLERYDNQPYGLAWEILLEHLFPKIHPYSWPTIGSVNDIKSYTLEDVSDFFSTYYTPPNASLVIAGDFDTIKTKEMIEQYFGSIVQATSIVRPVVNPFRISQENIIERRENVQLDRIYFAWNSETAFGDDDAALDIMSDILSGSKGSRLYKKLVHELELTQDITVFQYSGKLAGHLMIVATAKPGVELDKIKKEIFKELSKLKKNGVTKKELIKTKNGIRSGFIYSLQNIDSLADQLNFYNFYLNEPNSFSKDLQRYSDVTNENVKAAADKYLTAPFVELRITPNK